MDNNINMWLDSEPPNDMEPIVIIDCAKGTVASLDPNFTITSCIVDGEPCTVKNATRTDPDSTDGNIE